MVISDAIKMIEKVEKEYGKVSALDWLKDKLNANALKREIRVEDLSNVLIGIRSADKGRVLGYKVSPSEIVDLDFLMSWYCDDMREPTKEDFRDLFIGDSTNSFDPISK